MKKLIQIVTATILSVTFIGSMVSAQQSSGPCNGSINVSGNNSNVTIDCNDIRSVVITCNNNVDIVTVNYQNGTSGSASVTGNASGGNASSGSVFNNNDSTVNTDASCAVASTSPTPTTTVTPTVSPTQTPGKGAVTPASLPNTAGVSAESAIVAGLALAAIIVAASRLVVAAYRYFTIK